MILNDTSTTYVYHLPLSLFAHGRRDPTATTPETPVLLYAGEV